MPPDRETDEVAIVLVHGGAGQLGDRSDLSAWQARYREAGFTTLSIDYKLLGAEPGEPVYPVPELNAKAAVPFLHLHGRELGTSQVIVQGHSAGARLRGMLLTTRRDPGLKGPELWPGVSDAIDGLIGFYGYFDGYQFEAARYYGGDGIAPSSATSTINASAA